MGAKLPKFAHIFMGRFLCLHRVNLAVDYVQVDNRLTFDTNVDKRLDIKHKPKRTVPFKNLFSARVVPSGNYV